MCHVFLVKSGKNRLKFLISPNYIRFLFGTIPASKILNGYGESLKQFIKCLLNFHNFHENTDSMIMLQRIISCPFMIFSVIQTKFLFLHNTEHTRLYLHLNSSLPAVVNAEYFSVILQFKFRYTLFHMHV